MDIFICGRPCCLSRELRDVEKKYILRTIKTEGSKFCSDFEDCLSFPYNMNVFIYDIIIIFITIYCLKLPADCGHYWTQFVCEELGVKRFQVCEADVFFLQLRRSPTCLASAEDPELHSQVSSCWSWSISSN